MSELKLVIGNKNYSLWSVRPWLLMRQQSIEFEEIQIPLRQPDSLERKLVYSPAGKVAHLARWRDADMGFAGDHRAPCRAVPCKADMAGRPRGACPRSQRYGRDALRLHKPQNAHADELSCPPARGGAAVLACRKTSTESRRYGGNAAPALGRAVRSYSAASRRWTRCSHRSPRASGPIAQNLKATRQSTPRRSSRCPWSRGGWMMHAKSRGGSLGSMRPNHSPYADLRAGMPVDPSPIELADDLHRRQATMYAGGPIEPVLAS